MDVERVAHGFAMKYGLKMQLTYPEAMALEAALSMYLHAVLNDPDPSWQTDAEGWVTEPLVNEGAK